MAQVNAGTPQLSAGVTPGIVTIPVHADVPVAVIFAGQLMVGSCVSLMVTLKLHVAALPEASCTVYSTVVTPLLKRYVPTLWIPVAGEEALVAPVIVQVSAFTEQLSLVVGFGVTTKALHTPISEFFAILPEQLIVGSSVS